MDRQTLSNYGWIVICVMVLAVILGLATPFGKYIDNAVQNTIHAYGKAEDDAVKNVGAMQSEWDEMLDLPTSHNTTIPSGAVYYSEMGVSNTGDYTNATAIYKKGDEFPELQNGDVYVYGDYEYRYNVVPYTINISEVG